MNIDKHIRDIIVGSAVLTVDVDKVVSKIKQSILKAIMEKKPKLNRSTNEDNIAYLSGFQNGIYEFESVIKEVLQTKTNE